MQAVLLLEIFMQYKLIASNSIIEFQDKVNNKIKEGWSLYGNSTQVAVPTTYDPGVMFYQAITKETD